MGTTNSVAQTKQNKNHNKAWKNPSVSLQMKGIDLI